jgi:hypothetical protein
VLDRAGGPVTEGYRAEGEDPNRQGVDQPR